MQMILQQQRQPQPQPQHHHLQQQQQRGRRFLPPLGLKNLGNTCYLNSVLQCLTYTPPLSNFSLKSHHTTHCTNPKRPNCPFCVLEKRIARSLTIDAAYDTPSRIHSCLTIFGDHFQQGRQEDAHEFLRYVIDACNDTGDGVVKGVFGGALRSQVKCLGCGAESNKVDDIMDVSLDLVNSTCVGDGLRRFFQTEVLDGNNKYKCANCKKLVVAEKRLSILQAPNVLVIHLKRFEGAHGGKIDRIIGFEDVLGLSSYMCEESQDLEPEYKLFGTIVHSGYSPESGHYYSYIKNTIGKWYCCNDSYVLPSTLQEVLSEKVYILFFSRTNQRPQPNKKSLTTTTEKSTYCNGNGVSGGPKTASPPMMTMPTKLNGVHFSDKDKNGKVSLRFGKLKSLDSEGTHANGNGNLTKEEYKKENIILKESIATGNADEAVTLNNGVNADRSPDAMDHESKQAMLLPLRNGEIQSNVVKSKKTEACEHNGTGHALAFGGGCESYNNSLHTAGGAKISGFKRKSPDTESEDSLTSEKFIERLTEETSSCLQSCNWHDEVYRFMCARKISIDSTSNIISSIELRKMLIAEAKQNYISKIPESLKQQLVESLRPFIQQNLHLDT